MLKIAASILKDTFKSMFEDSSAEQALQLPEEQNPESFEYFDPLLCERLVEFYKAKIATTVIS